jgi:hypothetical protein
VTVVLTLVLVASIGVGIWDLFSNASTTPLRAALIFEGGLLLGSALQLFLPLGFVAGAAAGLLAGIPAFDRWAHGRVARIRSLAGLRDDDALVLLELHDHLDSLDSELSLGTRLKGALALAALAAAGISLVTLGLLDAPWAFLPIGSLALLLPVGHLMRRMSLQRERRELERAITDSTHRIGESSDHDDG